MIVLLFVALALAGVVLLVAMVANGKDRLEAYRQWEQMNIDHVARMHQKDK